MWEKISCSTLIRQIHLAIAKQSNNVLRQHNLTMSQFMALQTLEAAPQKELSLKELERALQTSQPDAAGIVIRLEKKGLVESFTDTSDRRIKRVRILPSGEQSRIKAGFSMSELEKTILSDMPDDEQEVFEYLLKKVNSHF